MKRRIDKRLWEVSLAALISLIVAMMIIPLSPWMLDVLISFNLGVSILIFCLALFKKDPLKFSSFPTLLLIATLYRLALNVSSTRLILTRADAGKIIGGFGGYIVGNDIIVGSVIFMVILMVLFLVITKGAERVAEVAARFTLDALPGMQLAIESDLRSRTISPREMAVRREQLEQRSMYYGALDGAMKFVRGDAVAALVITAVNIFGGTLIGVLRRDLSIVESLNIYGRLTVGDGLVSMIPALLISTAAGLLVTRVAQGTDDKGLADQIGTQLLSEPKALFSAALLMALLAIVPGLPAWPFLLAAVITFSFGLVHTLGRRRQPGIGQEQHVSERTIGLDALQKLLDEESQRHPVLVREAVWERVTLSQLADIVNEFKKDGVDESHMSDLLDALARIPIVDSIDDMMMLLRQRMVGTITSIYRHRSGEPIIAYPFELETEQMLQSSIVSGALGKRLILEPALLTDLRQKIQEIYALNPFSIILTGTSLRRPLQRLIDETVPGMKVVGHGELLSSLSLQMESEIRL